MVTWAPADNFNLQSKGSLRLGYDGDLTIFNNVEKGEKVLTDSNGNQRKTDTLIKPIYSVIAGNEYSIGGK
jgi:Predicted amidohydrolase